jgi:hypothetical protein
MCSLQECNTYYVTTAITITCVGSYSLSVGIWATKMMLPLRPQALHHVVSIYLLPHLIVLHLCEACEI